MKRILGLLILSVKLVVFFTLFAFALNNLDDVTVRFFFGTEWQAPLVLVLLAVFALGIGLGVLSVLPRLRHKHKTLNPPPAPHPNPSNHGA